ncbi:hypothetical protein Dimus_033863 [Dionaea muscipula]
MTAVRGLLLILDPKPHTKLLSDFVMRLWLVKEEKVLQVLREALGLVPKGSSGVPSSFMHSQMPESFERMVLQLEEANTMNNWLKEQLTASAQHEQRMHEYYTSPISTGLYRIGIGNDTAPPPRSIPEPPSFSTHVHHRDPLNAPSTSQSNAHDDDDDASLEESHED